MTETSINLNAVIDELAEQVRRLTLDNAVLRAAIKSLQNAEDAAEHEPNPNS
jgi:prefoldin subunit 5